MAEQRLRILPGSGAVTFDADFASKGFATLTGNMTLTLTGMNIGKQVTLWFTQDGTGSRTLTLTAFSGGANVTVGTNTFNGAAGTTTKVMLININNILFVEYGGAGGSASSVPFANVTGKPTTLVGYGITDAIPTTQKGAANGVATLDATTHVPTAQLGSGSATNVTTLHGDNSWS